jgi:hypothetical protein
MCTLMRLQEDEFNWTERGKSMGNTFKKEGLAKKAIPGSKYSYLCIFFQCGIRIFHAFCVFFEIVGGYPPTKHCGM